MPPASLLPFDIAGVLGRGGTVVTSNQRAARTLRLAFDRSCLASGRTSWHPPAIFAWETWTASLYRQAILDGRTTRILLNHTQELQVWRSVIESDSHWASLQAIDSLAEMAYDAWRLLCAYRGQHRLQTLGVSGDTRNFQRWAQGFSRRCRSDEYLPAAELEEALVTAGCPVSGTTEVLLVGFDSKTPAQQALIDHLCDGGVLIGDEALDPIGERVHLAVAENPEAELSQAAVWIRDFLSINPQSTVAVIVPGLAAERGKIDPIFRQILAPELESIAVNPAAGPYEFSLGQPLSSTPLIAVALELLRFAAGALPISSISRMLLSPYFATGPIELFARAEFDAFGLRTAALLRPEMTLKRLVALVSTSKSATRTPNLLSQLRSLERTVARLLADSAPIQRPWSQWSDVMRELLQSSGWPGSKALDSIEFQTRRKFEAALDELATLDFEGTRPTFAESLNQCEAILRRTLFAPESREAPIQVMSPLEAAGSRFDAIFFLRASDFDWPVRPWLNPLLGWRLQHEFGMPGSSAALDLTHAQHITDRIAASAQTVFFSYAKETEEHRQRPSPLLAHVDPKPFEFAPLSSRSAQIDLETIEDNAFIPLRNFTVAGGANILKQQAACGFLAFAEKRLWSTPVKMPEPGMDALERGNIVHDVLEEFWRDLRTQAALRELSPEQQAAQLSRSIEHSLQRAVAQLAADPSTPAWDSAYLEVQRERLRRLLTPWLKMELERFPFEVAQREESETVMIGPLSLKIRIDRVDRLLDKAGGSVLIDYKTGLAKPTDWEGDRPDEPQLPLYAVVREPESLAAVAFANIRAGKEMTLQGYSDQEYAGLKRSKMTASTLEGQLVKWQGVLTSLAESFAAGDARVRPKSYPTTCAHCDQRLLCRLDPASLVADDEEDEAIEGDDV